MNDKKRVIRVAKNKDNPFVMMDKRPIENPRLSWKAKGILSYLLSRPDDWEINIYDLTNRSTDGEAAVRSGLKELRDANHVVYKGREYKDGRIIKSVWVVYEKPQLDSENQHEEKLHEENHPLNNKDSTDNESSKEKAGEKTPATEKPKYSKYKDDIAPIAEAWEITFGRRALIEGHPGSGYSSAKPGEIGFWMRGSNKSGAKGLYYFLEMGATPEDILSAGRVANGQTGGRKFTLSNPNSLWPFVERILKDKKPSSQPGDYANDLKARQEAAKAKRKARLEKEKQS
jgi:hypothetical protein